MQGALPPRDPCQRAVEVQWGDHVHDVRDAVRRGAPALGPEHPELRGCMPSRDPDGFGRLGLPDLRASERERPVLERGDRRVPQQLSGVHRWEDV